MKKGKLAVNPLKVLAVVFAVLFVVSALMLAVNLWERSHGTYEGEGIDASSQNVEYNGEEYTLKGGVQTVLLMGLDKFEGQSEPNSYNNDQQADFLMLLVIDNDTQKYKVLHINRDTMAEMNMLGVGNDKIGTTTKQLALSHTYGVGGERSCRNTADAVSKLLLGVHIDHYVSVTMDAVPEYTDMLGGVEVTVLDDFTGIDSVLVQGEKVNLTGSHALTYVRTREGVGDATNESRMERQRQFIEAVFNKTSEKISTTENFTANAVTKLGKYIVSDPNLDIQRLVEKVDSYEFAGSYGIDGESVKGTEFMEFYADEDSIEKTVIDLFYEKN